MRDQVGSWRIHAHQTTATVGSALVALLGGCIDPVTGINGPSPGLGSATDSQVSKGESEDSGVSDTGGPVSEGSADTGGEGTTTASGGTDPSTTTASSTAASTTETTANPTISGSSSQSGGSDGGSTTTGGGDDGASKNECGLLNAYGDLGFLADTAGFFGDFSPPTTGADLYLTSSNAPTFDAVFLQLFAEYAPFPGFPFPGTFQIDGTSNVDPEICGVCASIVPDASFGPGNTINSTTRLHATAGTVVIDRVDHGLFFPGTPRIAGHLEDVVFIELFPDSFDINPNGCITTLDYVEFDTTISIFIN